jgi:hypothetical protein
MIRLPAFFLPLMLLAAGCDDLPGGNADDKKPATPAKPATPKSPTTPAPAVTNTVTGSWYYKKEIMKLTQSGASIQGTTALTTTYNNDPANPIQYPVPTVGSVESDGAIKISELINYTKQPAKNYKVDKVGTLKGDTLTLNVVKGQAPHMQTWTRR